MAIIEATVRLLPGVLGNADSVVDESHGEGGLVEYPQYTRPLKFRGPYVASKHALEGLSICLRAELQGSGVHVSLIEPGPVKSKIATNALPWLRKNVDIEASPPREAYRRQLERLTAGGSVSRFKPGPEAVYPVLKHALLSPRPRPHYLVTKQAALGATLKRLLPAALFYRLLGSQA